MTADVEALRGYVHFLRERGDVRQVKLTLAARQGLAQIIRSRDASKPQKVAVAGPCDGSVARARATDSPERGTLESTANRANVVGARRAEPSQGPATTTLPIIEISGSTKAEQLAHLAERAAVCVKCPHLVARRHNVVFGVGDPEAKLMFIGEAPGEEEDLKGEPFVGRAGQLLTKMIIAMGLTREQVYIANIVKCRPDMPEGAPGNRKPTKQEMDTCVPYLRAQVEVIKPGAIVALGATSVEGLLGPIGSIGSLRGKFHEYRGIPLMPTYHPSYLLRNASNTEKRKVWDDLLKVMERLEMPISEKQRGYFLKG